MRPSVEHQRVQEAGFEPANRYGLGPHPSAFDQAGRLLRQVSVEPRVFQNREPILCEDSNLLRRGKGAWSSFQMSYL